MEHRIPHPLGLERARAVTRQALQSYLERFAAFSPGGRWRDEDHAEFRFEAAGQVLEGLLRVEPDAIVIELEVPLIFRPLRRRAIEAIEEEVRRWVERAQEGGS